MNARRVTLPRDEALSQLAAVSDPVHRTALRQLTAGRACVCSPQSEVEVAPNPLSYELKVLSDADPVLTRRLVRCADYVLAPDIWASSAAALSLTEATRS